VGDTKAMGRKIGFIHYVIETVEKVNPQVIAFVEELNELPKAAAVSMPTLATEFAKLTKDVSDIEREIEHEDEDSAAFRVVFSHFLASAKLDLNNVKEEIKKMDETLKQMFQYLGEDASKSEKANEIEDYFKLLVNFRQLFEQALKDLAKEKEDIARAAAKASKVEDVKRPRSQTQVGGTPQKGNERVLDGLFASMKKGNFKIGNNQSELKESNHFVLPRHGTFGMPKSGSESTGDDGGKGKEVLVASGEMENTNVEK